MKKLLRLYRNWRYHRLYCKLLWHFLKRGMDGKDACFNAAFAFEWIAGFEYAELFKHHHKPDV